MRRFTTITKAIAVFLLCVSHVLAETLPLQRVDSNQQQVGPLTTLAWAIEGGGQPVGSAPPPASDSDPVFASASAQAAAQASANTLAFAYAAGTAMVNAAVNAIVFLGEADTSAQGEASASADQNGWAQAGWTIGDPGALANATFQVQPTGSYPAGPATASEMVTITVGGGTNPLNGGAITVTAGATVIVAVAQGAGGWLITGTRSTSTASNPDSPPEPINLNAPPEGFTIMVVGTSATGVGGTLNVTAQIAGFTQGVQPQEGSNWSFSATASVTVNTPPP